MLKDMNFEELLAAAVESNSDALLELSDRYHKGTGGVPQRDEVKAYTYAMQACTAGNIEAIARIADYYAKGRGGAPLDEEKAKALLLEGEKAGSIRCLQKIAHNYKNGECGFPKDETKAIEYCTKIIANPKDDANVKGYAYTCIGSIYEDGRIGAEKDIKKALTFYQKAAKTGYAFAYVLLANYKRKLYLPELEKTVAAGGEGTMTPEEKNAVKASCEKLKESINTASDLYAQARDIAEKDADTPVFECAKAYLEQTDDDYARLSVFEKKFALADAENYDADEKVNMGTFSITLDSGDDDETYTEEVDTQYDINESYDGAEQERDFNAKIDELLDRLPFLKTKKSKFIFKVSVFSVVCVLVTLAVVLIIAGASKG